MTAEERFERIERTLAEVADMQRAQGDAQTRIYESHLKLQDAVMQLTMAVSRYSNGKSRQE